jgi:3-keto-disaccharide hydrolase
MIKILLALLVLLPQDAKPPEGAVVLDAAQFTKEDGKPCDWPVVDGALEVGKGSIMTKEKYRDFQLHVEFNIPEPPEGSKGQARSNSGVYLQRRYEIQVLECFGQDPPVADGGGSIYKQKAPDKNAAKKAGEWQTYDITFRGARFDAAGKKSEGARITVVWNGVKVHDNYEIKDKTGSGKPEGPEPGPILLQDHGAKVKFRNLWIVSGKDAK